LLGEEAGAFDRHVGPGAPSVVRIFRAIDALREALAHAAVDLEPTFRELYEALERRHTAVGGAVDGDGRTRVFVADGFRTLEVVRRWSKPPK
jgi:hypothetical protein